MAPSSIKVNWENSTSLPSLVSYSEFNCLLYVSVYCTLYVILHNVGIFDNQRFISTDLLSVDTELRLDRSLLIVRELGLILELQGDQVVLPEWSAQFWNLKSTNGLFIVKVGGAVERDSWISRLL